MPVVIDSTASRKDWLGGNAVNGSRSVTLNVNPLVEGRRAFVGVEWVGLVNASAATFTVKLGGQNMTLLGDNLFNSNQNRSLFYVMENQPTGPQQVEVSFAGMPTEILGRSLLITAVSYSGVDRMDAVVTAGGTASTSNSVGASPGGKAAGRFVSFHASGQGVSNGSFTGLTRARESQFNGGYALLGDSDGANTVINTLSQSNTSQWRAYGVYMWPAVVNGGAKVEISVSVSSSAGTYRNTAPAPDRTWVIDGGTVDMRVQDTRVGPRGEDGQDGVGVGSDGAGGQVFDHMDRWRTAVARRAVRNPRMLVIGDSASTGAGAWQHQLAGRRYFSPQDASVLDGYLEVAFAVGLTGAQMLRYNNVGHLTDIDLLVAPDSANVGDHRYDEGAWSAPWTTGTVYSNEYPVTALIDRVRIDNMNGANALSVRAAGGTGETYWYGMNADVGSAQLDVMSLALGGLTADWWADRLTGPTNDVGVWGNGVIRALADGFAPDLIVIALGANDLDNAGVVNNVGANLAAMIAVLRGDHPNADIALQTYWQPVWTPVRQQVLDTAEAEGVALLDFWPLIPPYSANPSLYADQYHLNEYGQRLMADLAAEALGLPAVSLGS